MDDVDQGKPHPEPFASALARLNDALRPNRPILPDETVAIEDATGGARAACEAGMRVVAIRGLGYDPSSGYADMIIDRLEPQVLGRIMEAAA
jgi:beta-phosphoglucomutase-like phosphatase (HAD superfamily)